MYRSTGPFSLALLCCLVSCLAFAPVFGADIEFPFDLKPTDCPNLFDTSQFVAPQSFDAALVGTDSLDVSRIAASSLVIVVPGGGGLLATNITPSQFAIEDVTTPLLDPEFCECIADGADGINDLTMKLDTQAVRQALGVLQPGTLVELLIQGDLVDGSTLEGSDCLLILGPVPVDARSWGSAKSSYR